MYGSKFLLSGATFDGEILSQSRCCFVLIKPPGSSERSSSFTEWLYGSSDQQLSSFLMPSLKQLGNQVEVIITNGSFQMKTIFNMSRYEEITSYSHSGNDTANGSGRLMTDTSFHISISNNKFYKNKMITCSFYMVQLMSWPLSCHHSYKLLSLVC